MFEKERKRLLEISREKEALQRKKTGRNTASKEDCCFRFNIDCEVWDLEQEENRLQIHITREESQQRIIKLMAEIEPSEEQKVCQCHLGLNYIYKPEGEAEKKERLAALAKQN